MTRRHVFLTLRNLVCCCLRVSGRVEWLCVMLPLSTILVSLFYGAFSGPTLVLAATYLFVLSGLLSFSGLVGSDWTGPVVSQTLMLSPVTAVAVATLFVTSAFITALSFKGGSLMTRRLAGVTLPKIWPLLVLLLVTGVSLFALALDYVSAYIGLEMQSFGAYIMTALSGASEAEATSGLLYFFVGSLGSVAALLGLSVSYLQTASLTWGLWPFASAPSPLVTAGLLLKIGSGPFSFWVPMVYSAVPLMTLAWLTSSPLIGLVTKLWAWSPEGLVLYLAVLLSLMSGSVGGLGQDSLKPILAWSSVAQLGFLLAILAASSSSALAFYLPQYLAATLLLVTVNVAAASQLPWLTSQEPTSLHSFAGVGEWVPYLALSAVFAIMSLGGIPPLVGFYAKAAAFLATLETGAFVVVATGCVSSVVSMAYYLVLVSSALFVGHGQESALSKSQTPTIDGSVLALAVLAVTAGGLAPTLFYV